MQRTIIMMFLTMLLCGAHTTPVMAKKKMVEKMYLFGFSASFKDSVVFFTDVQEISNVWYDTRKKFLLGREYYSQQLKTHLAEKNNEPNRTCLVMFATKRKSAEKKFLKLKHLYTQKAKGKYRVSYLPNEDFRFTPVELDFSE